MAARRARIIPVQRIAVFAGVAALCAIAVAQRNSYPGSGTSGPGRPVTGSGWGGGWRTTPDGVTYRGPDPQLGWSLDFDGLATGSAVTRGLLPPIKPLLELHMRDTSITRGGDGNYYMTGTTGDNPWWFNDGVELWRSSDLRSWHYVGVVWSIDDDATWQRAWRLVRGKQSRAVWAPEIHYIRGNYVITMSMAPGGVAILRSRTGRPEGPYISTLDADRPLTDAIDPTLFEEDDGSVYFTYGGAGYIARMRDDLSGLAEPYRRIELEDPDHIPAHHADQCAGRGMDDLGYEGAVLFKAKGKYYIGAADNYEGRYSVCLAMADRIYGPYRKRHEAVPGAGNGVFFRDGDGHWWSTYSGNDRQQPFREKPGIVRVEFDRAGLVHVAKEQPAWLLVDKK